MQSSPASRDSSPNSHAHTWAAKNVKSNLMSKVNNLVMFMQVQVSFCWGVWDKELDWLESNMEASERLSC